MVAYAVSLLHSQERFGILLIRPEHVEIVERLSLVQSLDLALFVRRQFAEAIGEVNSPKFLREGAIEIQKSRAGNLYEKRTRTNGIPVDSARDSSRSF